MQVEIQNNQILNNSKASLSLSIEVQVVSKYSK